MKIERLSENQIRCTLNKSDLASRQLKISELAYGSEKARELFRDMMQQASYELGFEAENIPLMIEAIPVSAECIVLIITKVDNPEELDTRFSRFSPSDRDFDDDDFDYNSFPDIETIGQDYSSSTPTANEELDFDLDEIDKIEKKDSTPKASSEKASSEAGSDNDSSSMISEFLGNDLMNLFGKVRDYLNNGNTSDKSDISDDLDKFIPLGQSLNASKNISEKESSSLKNSSGNTKSAPATRIYSFGSLDDISCAARSILPVFSGSSALFKNSDRYYLVIDKAECSSVNFNKTCNILTEYGEKVNSNGSTSAFLSEHTDCIIKTDAVGIMSGLQKDIIF